MATFVRVVDTGSISRAAEQIGIAKSAVSRRLNDLESYLGSQLIKRSTRKLSITNTGQSYYDVCVRLLNDVSEAEAAISSAHQNLVGTLRVAAPTSFGVNHLPDAVSKFCHQHPNVRFDIDFNDRKINIIEENIDVAIRIGQLEDSRLIARRLFDLNVVMCASHEFIKRYGHPSRPEDLIDLPYIKYTGKKNLPIVYQTPTRVTGNFKPNITHQCSNGEFICHMAAQHLGYTLTPTFIAHKFIQSGQLLPILTDYDWGQVSAYAIYPSARHLSFRLRAFIDFLVDEFDGTPYWDSF